MVILLEISKISAHQKPDITLHTLRYSLASIAHHEILVSALLTVSSFAVISIGDMIFQAEWRTILAMAYEPFKISKSNGSSL